MNKSDVRVSKALSYLLRHGAEKEKLRLSSDGYARVDDILKHRTLQNVTLADVQRVVKNNEKQRFKLIQDNGGVWKIRANQGHSIAVDVAMKPIRSAEDAPVVVHGTSRAAYRLIATTGGLKPMGRQHIHFALGLPGATGVISGMRASCEVFIYIDLEQALADGIPFFRSENGVILSPGDKTGCIAPSYFSRVVTRT